jgi:hypothetical protein
MNQANQQKLVQETNMNLVAIRSAEIEYFSTFFSNFGTQSALIIGCIMGSVSQVPGINSNINYFFVVMYWISTAVTLAGALHVLLCTIFINVFGQGLALRGPLGSMVQAVEGMVIEQKQVLFSFIVTTAAFGVNCIGMYWIMMDQASAITSSVITLVGMYFWYHYCLRIYNRFKFSSKVVDWDNAYNPEHNLDDHDDEVVPKDTKVPFKDARKEQRSISSIKNPLVLDDTKSVHSEASNATHMSELYLDLTSTASNPEEHDCGYLTLKTDARFLKDPWERKWFLVRRSRLYYYSDKASWTKSPSKPINNRPIDMEGYTLIAGTVEPPYPLSLVPIDPNDIRKTWHFRCDTLAEFNRWLGVFSRALNKTATDDSHGDLVAISANGTGTIIQGDDTGTVVDSIISRSHKM